MDRIYRTSMAAFASAVLLVACTSNGSSDEPTSQRDRAEPTVAPIGSPTREVERAAGALSCHDVAGDVLSEGSGDRSGPSPSPPSPAQPGADIGGVSLARYATGMTLNFGTIGRVPTELPGRARLFFIFGAHPVGNDDHIAVISAVLQRDQWTIDIRQDDRTEVFDTEPAVVRDVLSVDIEAEDVPDLMRGRFRWKAHTEWVPRPTDSSSEIFFDYCPDSGFPVFRGTST